MLQRKNIIITGGRGGIAQATQQFIMDNSDIFCVYAPDEYILDVTDENKVKNYFKNIDQHILINCAA